MSRLLTEEEIEGIVKNARTLTCAIEAVAQAQDDLTAHLVAQDILDELEEKCNCYPDFDFMDTKGACPACRRNIKSKWGIE